MTTRLSTDQRGYTWRWRKARAIYLQRNPLCVMCKDVGLIKEASVVDHKKPHRGDHALFWDETNWQGLCYRCHNSIKQSIEKGGTPKKQIGIDGYPIDD